MLDGCGIETYLTTFRRAPRAGGRDRCSMAVESRLARPAGRERRATRRDRCSMAVESRLLFCARAQSSAVNVAIDARWLWNRDPLLPVFLVSTLGSRSMLDGCGIETDSHS